LKTAKLNMAGIVVKRRVAARLIATDDEMSWIMNFIKSPWVMKDGKLSWVATYSLACVVLIVMFVVIFRHLLGLDVLNYDSQIGVAALLGIAGVIGLSVALMAATFYSSRSGIDDAVGDAHDVGTQSPSDRHEANDGRGDASPSS
jgi:hypothetical protein